MEQPPIKPTTQSSTQPTQLPNQPQKPTPNNPNKKPLLIGLVICAILAVAGIAFGIFGLITFNHANSEISDLKDIITTKDQTISSLKDSKPETTPTETPAEPETKPQTNSYSLFADNLAKNSTNIFGYYYHYTGTENVQRTMLAEVKDGHLKITDLDDNSKLIAEADGIISAYFIHVGNGSTPYFYLIHKDGKISRICISENVDRTIEALNDYNNIISVFEGSDLFAYLVDINGNVYQTH